MGQFGQRCRLSRSQARPTRGYQTQVGLLVLSAPGPDDRFPDYVIQSFFKLFWLFSHHTDRVVQDQKRAVLPSRRCPPEAVAPDVSDEPVWAWRQAASDRSRPIAVPGDGGARAVQGERTSDGARRRRCPVRILFHASTTEKEVLAFQGKIHGPNVGTRRPADKPQGSLFGLCRTLSKLALQSTISNPLQMDSRPKFSPLNRLGARAALPPRAHQPRSLTTGGACEWLSTRRTPPAMVASVLILHFFFFSYPPTKRVKKLGKAREGREHCFRVRVFGTRLNQKSVRFSLGMFAAWPIHASSPVCIFLFGPNPCIVR